MSRSPGRGGIPASKAAPAAPRSNGWRLIYCKGSEGEQLEFVQALGPVKKTFGDALEARRQARST